ncbi:MAG TPA: DUF72 domain-containing protein [Acidimicrobiales bacterium]|jgi:uncharacterized protein YecE (DUF72 family)
MPVLIGTSGWHYADWRRHFYPNGVAQKHWLHFYADRFDTVEINSSFYRLPSIKTVAQWNEATPEGFRFSLKVSRYVTHVKKLHQVRDDLSTLLQRVDSLGPKLGPLLLQLPPTFRKDLDALGDTLSGLRGLPVACEPRHPSWFDDDVAELLAHHNAALCLADNGGRPTGPLWRTADWGYIRFHRGRSQPTPCYGRRPLSTWADRCARLWHPGETVYAYFNNDTHVCAVRDARVFARLVERVGLEPSTVPGPHEVHLAQ